MYILFTLGENLLKMNKIDSMENTSYQQSKKFLAKETEEKLLKKLYDLVESSTSHGLPNIFRTQRIFIKIIWAFCFAVALGACLYQVYNGFFDYFQYDTVSKTEYITEIPSVFPTVSICSVNPLSTGDAQNLVEKKLIEIGFDLTKYNLSMANISNLIIANKLALLEAYNPDYGDENRKKLGFNIRVVNRNGENSKIFVLFSFVLNKEKRKKKLQNKTISN